MANNLFAGIDMYDSPEEALSLGKPSAPAKKESNLFEGIDMYDSPEEAQKNMNPFSDFTSRSSLSDQFRHPTAQMMALENGPGWRGMEHGMKRSVYQTGANLLKLAGTKNLAQQWQEQVGELNKDPNYLNAEKEHPYQTMAGTMAGEMLPYLMGGASLGAAGLPARMATMSGIGAVTSENPLLGGLLGAGAEIAAPILGSYGQKATRALEKSQVGSKARQLWQTARGEFDQVHPETIKNVEHIAHEQAKKEVTSYNTPKHAFDSDSYIRALEDRRDQVIADLKKTPSSPELQGERDRLMDWIHAAPKTYAEALELNKHFNQLFGGQLSVGVKMRDWLPSFAIKSIKKAMGENLEKHGLTDTLGKTIRNANHITKERVKHEIFRDARDEMDLLKRYQGMDEHTRNNLFTSGQQKHFQEFDKALNGDTRIYRRTGSPMLDDLKHMLSGGFPGALVAGSNQPLPEKFSK